MERTNEKGKTTENAVKSSFRVGSQGRACRMSNEAQQRLAPLASVGTDERRKRKRPTARRLARFCTGWRVTTTVVATAFPMPVASRRDADRVGRFSENFPARLASGHEFLYNGLVPVSRFISMEPPHYPDQTFAPQSTSRDGVGASGQQTTDGEVLEEKGRSFRRPTVKQISPDFPRSDRFQSCILI